METEAQVGYRDAIRQVHKALERRKHHLTEGLAKVKSDDHVAQIHAKVEEIDHVIQIIESLHR